MPVSGPHRATTSQAIVLAGGLGTRLRSALPDLPKVLAPVAGRPWLVWLLEALAAAGFARVCLATGYLGDQVRAAIGARMQAGDHGMDIVYSHEDSPLGTGGAVCQALSRLASEPTFVLNGDTWIGLDWEAMRAVHDQAGAAITIAARAVPDRARYGAIEVRAGRVCGFGEKSAVGPGLVNAGAYLLAPDVFARVAPPGASFSLENDYLAPELARLTPAAYVSDAPFLDIGIPADYARAEAFLHAIGRL